MFECQFDYHTYKFVLISLRLCMLWCETEILHAKNVISNVTFLNDCRIQLASHLSLFAQSHINL
jgi:hypothetical protein